MLNFNFLVVAIDFGTCNLFSFFNVVFGICGSFLSMISGIVFTITHTTGTLLLFSEVFHRIFFSALDFSL